MSDLDSIPMASAVLTPESLGPDPRVTPRIADGTQPPPLAPSAATSPEADDFGVAFDPSRHERALVQVPGGKRWRLKRGNAARAAAGKPMILPGGRVSVPPGQNPPLKSTAIASADPAPMPSQSTVAPDSPTPGESGTVDAVTAPASPLTIQECEIAAKAATNGVLAGARMWRGEHWTASPSEHTELVGSLSRVWMHYGLPRLGPLAEYGLVVVTFIFSAEQRRKDLRALWNWLLGRKPTPEPETSDAP